MIPALFFYQLVLVAFVWPCLFLLQPCLYAFLLDFLDPFLG